MNNGSCIFIEDESQRIGNLQIPMPLWYSMRKAPVFFMDIPFEERLDYITADYGKQKKNYLKACYSSYSKTPGRVGNKKCC